MSALKLTQIGNSVGVILPKELLAKLGVGKGDTIYAIDQPDGIRLTVADPDFEAQMAVARQADEALEECAARVGEMTVWLARQLILAIHDEQLAEHGGAIGVRDEGLLDSALARPLNRAGYGEPGVVELGALYAIAIARNHPFVDGNKRTAFAALFMFLALNGMEFEPAEVDATVTMLRLAAGDMPDEDFTTWVRDNTRPRGA